ncbi:unnamed protein product [Plutella xylostella]|uniref:(diamondback moth) hypothetical protein n=1 Tax=Plutella xylostella TaxID=51655 RepID=A0A8S4E4B1_PLUXY|nr:unnamed protein product [Plutella xylostella]
MDSSKKGMKKCKNKKYSLTVASSSDNEDEEDLNKFTIGKGIEKKIYWHPCDGKPPPCDPEERLCKEPILCLGKLKNPALPGEITKCLPGASVSVGACGGKSENGNKEQEDINENEVNQSTPHHPCDESEAKVCAANRGTCYPPHLIKDKIKNPEPDGVVKIQSKCT